MSFQLGNSSVVRKRVTVLLHDLDFSDLSACTFWLAPGQPLSPCTRRSATTKAWTTATISVYAATVGTEPWTRLDGVTFQRTPGSAALGTECIEPAVPGTETNRAGNVRLEGVRPTPGWTATADGWRTDAWTTRRAILQWTDVIDLTGVTSARLHFVSELSSRRSSGDVEVSLDGLTWQRLTAVPRTGVRTDVEVDLSAFAGRAIHLRFVFDAVGPDAGAPPDAWWIGDVSVRSPVPG